MGWKDSKHDQTIYNSAVKFISSPHSIHVEVGHLGT